MSELPMADSLAEAIEQAIGRVLTEHRAMSVGFVCMVDYIRIDPDDGDETSKYWSLCTTPGLSNVSLIGMSRVIAKWGDETAEAMFCVEVEDD